MNSTNDEYNWSNQRINAFEPMTHQDAYRSVDFMSDKEIQDIGYRDEIELQNFIDQNFMLYEAGA